jgi:HEAT repeat protein
LGAQEPYDDSAEELIAFERVRAAVELAFETYLSPAETGAERIDHAIEAAESLVPFGADAVPFLANELEQERGHTYDFCAYALGFLPVPSARQTLRDALDRAEATDGEAALARKAWAAYALGFHGDVEAVDLVNEGRHRSAHFPIHRQTSVLEMIAVQTAPESVPRLLAQLDRWSEDEAMLKERRWTLRALRRVADPAAVPKVAQLLAEDPNPTARIEAAHALSSMDTPQSIQALVAVLDDEETILRRTAALALDRLEAKINLGLLREKLQTESDPITRGAYYRMIVRLGGPGQLDALREHSGRPTPADRRLFIEALGLMGSRKALNLVAGALTDPDNAVAIAAVQALVASGAKNDVDEAIDVLKTGNWTVTQVAAEQLGAAGVTRAGAALADRMARAVGENPERIQGVRNAVYALSEAIVDLRYTRALPKLRAARERLTDSALTSYFDGTISRLQLIEKNGDEVAAWAAVTRDPLQEHRLLAYSRLGDIGSAEAARALVQAFDGVESVDRVEILRQAGRLDSPHTTALLKRVLLDPEFDPSGRLEEREMAAWGARRIGGPEMYRLLEAAVARRNGRDAKVLVYAAVLGGKQASSLIEKYRLVRLRYLKHSRGFEQEKLDWIARRLGQGLSVEAIDGPPEKVHFR